MTTTATPLPFKQQILDAVVPATASWFVAIMRVLEERVKDKEARWELLRQKLEQLSRET